MPKQASESHDRPSRPKRIKLVFCGFFERGCLFCGNPNFGVNSHHKYPVKVCFDCHMEGRVKSLFPKPTLKYR